MIRALRGEGKDITEVIAKIRTEKSTIKSRIKTKSISIGTARKEGSDAIIEEYIINLICLLEEEIQLSWVL